MQNPQDVQLAAETLKSMLPFAPESSATPPLGLVLGTGLSGVAAALLEPAIARVPFAALPSFPQSTVKSHEGYFIFGLAAGLPLIIQQGRCHLYEGWRAGDVCMGVRVMGELGVGTLVITNAAGALNPLFSAGGLMLMADMINHSGVSPLAGDNHAAWGARFPDMSETFDAQLRQTARKCALATGISLEEGVYIGVHGPEMETPAETRMYRQWGADAIGMSTVLEVIAARHMGMKVLGISCLANKNLPDCPRPAPLEEIIRESRKAGESLAALLREIFGNLARRAGIREGQTCPGGDD